MSARKQTPSTSISSDDRATQYARDVVAKKIIAGPLVRAACKRHLDDLKNAAKRGLVWNLEKAKHAIGFFAEVLKLNGDDFEGVPFVLKDWQAFIVGSLFGWYGEDGHRRFRVAYIEIGKGNGKSPLAAGIGLYMLVADGCSRAEIYAAATTQQQAGILFADAVAMVQQSPRLKTEIDTTGGAQVWNLAYLAKNSFFRAISAEGKGLDGKRVNCALIDELHVHPNAVVADKMRAGTKGKQGALILEITNSGVDRTSVCYAHHELSEQVVTRQQENDAWFAYVCGLDDGDEPLNDESCWIKSNPNLGVSIQLKYIREQVAEAKGMPSKESIVRRLNFCQWVDAADPWIELDLWVKCEDKKLKPLEHWVDREIVGALDLSGTSDLTALALGTRHPDGKIKEAWLEFWTPKDTLTERARRDRVPYDVWVNSGAMTATPGRSVDYAFVAQRIANLQAVFPLFKRLAFDPYRIKDFERELDRIGVEITLVPHPQGYTRAQGSDLWMPRSIELAEKDIGEATLHVVPNPCLRWNVASAVMAPDAKNNRTFTKRKAKGRIDGAVALTMLIGLLGDEPVDDTSVYEERGLLSF